MMSSSIFCCVVFSSKALKRAWSALSLSSMIFFCSAVSSLSSSSQAPSNRGLVGPTFVAFMSFSHAGAATTAAILVSESRENSNQISRGSHAAREFAKGRARAACRGYDRLRMTVTILRTRGARRPRGRPFRLSHDASRCAASV